MLNEFRNRTLGQWIEKIGSGFFAFSYVITAIILIEMKPTWLTALGFFVGAVVFWVASFIVRDMNGERY